MELIRRTCPTMDEKEVQQGLRERSLAALGQWDMRFTWVYKGAPYDFGCFIAPNRSQAERIAAFLEIANALEAAFKHSFTIGKVTVV